MLQIPSRPLDLRPDINARLIDKPDPIQVEEPRFLPFLAPRITEQPGTVGEAPEYPDGFPEGVAHDISTFLHARAGVEHEYSESRAPRLHQTLIDHQAPEELIRLHRELIEHRRNIADNPDVLVIINERAFTLVHVLTGLTATFEPDKHGARIGGIFAKSYSNPDRTGLPDVSSWQFFGYGVATRLYMAGAHLLPDQRWQDSAVRDTSRALRKKLHRLDPYGWQDKKCTVCETVYWEYAGRDGFPPH